MKHLQFKFIIGFDILCNKYSVYIVYRDQILFCIGQYMCF